MSFYSNGKILITGEYLVIDGALSLACPSRYGQFLKFSVNKSKHINWESFDFKGNSWFKCTLSKDDLNIISTSSEETVKTLINIIKVIREYNPSFLIKTGSKITSELTFEKTWGLGSSSTLIVNLSKLASVDPYIINSKIFNGSGYDIACANSVSPILYNIKEDKRVIRKIDFKPSFHNNMYFIFLNKKQNTLSEIKKYKNLKPSNSMVSEISDITMKILSCKNLENFNNLINAHEQIISSLIKRKSIKEKLFKDYKGEVKSLGAWGGDFIIATSETDPSAYFKQKGYKTIIKFEDMII